MIPEVDITPEIYLYYYSNSRIWTDEDGFEILNIHRFIPPYIIRVFLHDQTDISFPSTIIGEDCIINAFYFKEN